jgi:hypothetical protein
MDRDYTPETGELLIIETLCGRCGGAGTVACFLYPAPSERTRSAPCCGCGSREEVGEMVEVRESAPDLSLLPGDHLCASCAVRVGEQTEGEAGR